MVTIDEEYIEALETSLTTINNRLQMIELKGDANHRASLCAGFFAFALVFLLGGITVVATVSFPLALIGCGMIVVGCFGVVFGRTQWKKANLLLYVKH